MSTPKHHGHDRTPMRRATAAQILLLWRSRRPALLALVVGIVMAVSILVEVTTLDGWSLRMATAPAWLGVMFVVGSIWGILVWHEEGPSHRFYHWSMPLDMSLHDLARVLAGAVWLAASVAAFVVFVLVMAVATGQGTELRSLPALLWLSYLTAPLIGYLLYVALATVTGRALELGLLMSVGLAVMITELSGPGAPPAVLRPLAPVLKPLFLGAYGLLSAIGGMGRRAASEGVATAVRSGGAASASSWLVATGVWLAGGIALVLLASAWQRRR